MVEQVKDFVDSTETAPDAIPAVPSITAPEPFASLPDAYGDVTKANARHFTIDIRRPDAARVKLADGSYAKNADGSYATGSDKVSVRAMQGKIGNTLRRLPGAYRTFAGAVDYTTGARVRVTWTESRNEYTRVLRLVSVSNDVSGKIPDMGIVFAFKMADGSYKEWNVRVRNLVAIASVTD